MEIRSPVSKQEWADYYQLRYEVLRKPLNQPPGSERNDGDASGIHFALYDDGFLRAIARLDLAEPTIAQVRFVAVDTALQGKGYGRLIMEAVEAASRERGDRKMILHARDYAVEFYRKQDYVLVGESYKLFDVLQHYLMEKEYSLL